MITAIEYKDRLRPVLIFFYYRVYNTNMNENPAQQTNDVCKLNKRIAELEKKVMAMEEVLAKMSACFKEMPSFTANDMQNDVEPCTVNTGTVEEYCRQDAIDNNDGNVAYTAEDTVPQTQYTPTNEEEKAMDVEIRYLGAPSGNGFEMINERTTKSIDTLYILEIDRANGKAKFYPNNENLTQMIQSKHYYIDPVCDIEGSLDSLCYLNIAPENYGELLLDRDYWQVTKKCIIKC